MEAFSNYTALFAVMKSTACVYICWLLRNIMLDFSSYPVVIYGEGAIGIELFLVNTLYLSELSKNMPSETAAKPLKQCVW